MEENRIIERIRKLLRLSRSENPYEAALAAERVQRMLSEYNLTLEGIVDEETEKARQINRKTRKDLEEWAHILASRTASVFDCQYFHDPNTGETSFVGVGADPEVCGWMYGYLYKTLLRLASEHMRGPARRLRSSKSKREARKSFLLGAVAVISYRMIAQKKETPVTSCALVPVKERLIRAAMPIDSESSGERNWKSPNRNACIPGLRTTLCDPYGNGTVWEVRPERVKVPYMKPEGS